MCIRDRFLDVGCCFGQDVRRLIFDGAPIANVHGSDLQQPFLDLGYDLFQDHDKLPRSTFIAADVFDAGPESGLQQFESKVDIIHAASFFHLFGYQDSATVGRRFISLLRHQSGSMILGRQMGNQTAGEYEHKVGTGTMFRHNPESFKQWWAEVGEATGTRWEVEVEEDKSRTWLVHDKERGGGEGKREGKEPGTGPLEDPGRMALRFCMRML